jgi:hypothetical protein
VRYGDVVRIFVDGSRLGGDDSMAGVTLFNSTGKLCVGGMENPGDQQLFGTLDEVRISKGIARWTGTSFTVPTREYNNYIDSGQRIYKGSSIYSIPAQTLAGTHKLRIRKGATTYGVPLLATTDYYATGLRIYDGANIKSIPLETV